jgi:hypothetical protein
VEGNGLLPLVHSREGALPEPLNEAVTGTFTGSGRSFPALMGLPGSGKNMMARRPVNQFTPKNTSANKKPPKLISRV